MNLPAPLRPDEPARLEALRRLNILDTPIEARFERITRMAQLFFDMPMCLVSLVEGGRQWFKSARGLDVCETSRDVSFCAFGILQDQILIVPDATKDDRFKDNPLVTGDMHLRFYAGAQLRTPDGFTVGMLCVLDTKPREFDERSRNILRHLADLVEMELARDSIDSNLPKELILQAAEDSRMKVDTLTRVWDADGIERIVGCVTQPTVDFGRAVVSLSVDGLDEINAADGRRVGDEVLREVARRLVGCVRESDAVGRVSGGRFIAVLTPCDSHVHAEEMTRHLHSVANASTTYTASGRYEVHLRTGMVYVPAGRHLAHTEAIILAATAALESPIHRLHRRSEAA